MTEYWLHLYKADSFSQSSLVVLEPGISFSVYNLLTLHSSPLLCYSWGPWHNGYGKELNSPFGDNCLLWNQWDMMYIFKCFAWVNVFIFIMTHIYLIEKYLSPTYFGTEISNTWRYMINSACTHMCSM